MNELFNTIKTVAIQFKNAVEDIAASNQPFTVSVGLNDTVTSVTIDPAAVKELVIEPITALAVKAKADIENLDKQMSSPVEEGGFGNPKDLSLGNIARAVGEIMKGLVEIEADALDIVSKILTGSAETPESEDR